MPTSQNLLFSGSCPAINEIEHPSGAFLANTLSAQLNTGGWAVMKKDCWRDIGWSIDLKNKEISVSIVFSEIEKDQWLLQISPTLIPTLSFIQKLLGKKIEPASAAPSDCVEIAMLVHELLKANGFSPIFWCWDDFPNEHNSTPEPTNV